MEDNFSKLSFQNIWSAIKTYDLCYLTYLLENWYIDNIRWRIEHYILQQRCETCRNWHFCGRLDGGKLGNCDFHQEYSDFHDWCVCWNLDGKANDDYMEEDGWQRAHITPAGRKIVQVSKGGIWQFKHSGEFTDEELRF